MAPSDIDSLKQKADELDQQLEKLTDKISQQPENCENRNDPDLVQAFLKKWWVKSDCKATSFVGFLLLLIL
jgi:hypothetical protein